MQFIKRSLIQSEWQHIMNITLQFRGPLAKKFKEGKVRLDLQKGTTLSDLLRKAIESEESIREVWNSPEVIDREIARLKLESMKVKLDVLTEEQIKYLNSWEEGT